jgi:RND family efflux transporter MFP subunit
MTGCSKPHADVREDAVASVTAVTVAGAIESSATDRFPITIARDREANLSLRIGGTIEAIPVRIGERVVAGRVVAKVNATPYSAARVRAEADLARLERADSRNRSLVPAGALSRAANEDTGSAVEAARATLAAARYDEESAIARAPFSGVILARDVEVGETVAAGQRLLRIADLGSPLIARAAVPREVAARLRIGMAARLSLSTSDAAVAAHVRHVGAAADVRTGSVEVELAVDAGQEGVPSGTVGSVVFAFAQAGAAEAAQQRLPAEALLDAADGLGHVYLVDPKTSTAHKVTLHVKGFDGEQLRVSGLETGARVITYGAGYVRDGQKVAVVAR